MPMSFIVQTLKSLWVTRPSGLFWPTWLTITAAATICVAVAVRQRAAEGSRKSQKCLIEPMLTWRQVRTPSAVATLTLLAVFLVSYIALILVWEDFAYYDDSIFTLHTLQGHDYPPPIWRGEGRFFPLSVQEFNLIRHFTDTVIGYYFLPIIQLLIFSFILLILDVELSITARAILAILVLMTPSIVISFNNLHGPEHNILFLLACLVLFVSRFRAYPVYRISGCRGSVCSIDDILQGNCIFARLGLCRRTPHIALQSGKRRRMGLQSTLGKEKSS